MPKVIKNKDIYIGTLSGTSADYIDAVAVEINKDLNIICSSSIKIPTEMKAKILNLANKKINLKRFPSKDLIKLDEDFAFLTSKLINKLLLKNKDLNLNISAIGSHGQTIQHFPTVKNPYTLQIGNPSSISKITGIKTVADFRTANINHGGIGAPLTPAFHKEFFYSKSSNRVIINIGGITNITRLIPNSPIIGWDSGPGNCLIDQCVQFFSKNKKQFDKSGESAEKGDFKKLESVIKSTLSKKYFKSELPKSQSIVNFNFIDLYQKFKNTKKYSKDDWASAMTEITAKSIANDLNKFCNTEKLEIYLCGGGYKNRFLISRIKKHINSNWKVMNTKKLGLDPMLVEACTFAWLGKMRLEKKKINLKHSTGANPSTLGEIF